MKGLVFDTENRMQFKDFGEPLLDNLQKEVGGCIEVVHPKYLPEGLCMVIDDEGVAERLCHQQHRQRPLRYAGTWSAHCGHRCDSP